MLNVNEKVVDTSHLSPQKLFDHAWQVVKNEYYDPNFNRQYWIRWKNHYRGKIKTEDDAKVAIDTMLESLDDPYSRFLTKQEFADQNNSITSKISGIGVGAHNSNFYTGNIEFSPNLFLYISKVSFINCMASE